MHPFLSRLAIAILASALFTLGAIAGGPANPADERPANEQPATSTQDSPAEPADQQPPAADDAADQQGDEKKQPGQAQTPQDIVGVIRFLIDEGTASWTDRGEWPRDEADIAAQFKDLEIPADQVMKALTTRLHNHPALDSYVKWQLLSFAPSIGELTNEQRAGLIHALPPIARHPEPNISALNAVIRAQQIQLRNAANQSNPTVNLSGTGMGGFTTGSNSGMRIVVQRAFVSDLVPVQTGNGLLFDPTISVVNSGTTLVVNGTASPDGRYVTLTVQAVLTVLEELREFNVGFVSPALQARNEVLNNMPRQQGMRLYGMMVDVGDRIRAGSPTTEQAISSMLDEAEAIKDDPSVGSKARDQLYEQLKALYRVRNKTAKDVTFSRQRFQADYDTLGLSTDDFTAATAYLRGRDYRR